MSMVRWALLVDKVARWLCAVTLSAGLPMPAVRTIRGLSAKSVRAAAATAEALPWTNSSIALPRLLAVARLARLDRLSGLLDEN